MSMLDIDHVNNDGQQHRERFPDPSRLLADIKRQGFPRDKYRVLCSNCNQSRKRLNGRCEHEWEADARKSLETQIDAEAPADGVRRGPWLA